MSFKMALAITMSITLAVIGLTFFAIAQLPHGLKGY